MSASAPLSEHHRPIRGDALLEELCTRRLDHTPFPRVYVDATYVKAHRHGEAMYEAIVAATGVRGDGGLEILGIDVGDSENRQFWHRFLFSLRTRGLRGVLTIGSDRHGGLSEALGDVFPLAAWAHSPAPVDARPGGDLLPRTALRHVVAGRLRVAPGAVRAVDDLGAGAPSAS